MDKQKLKQYYDCWSSSWSAFRKWLELTDDWETAAKTAKSSVYELVRQNDGVKSFAEAVARNLIYETDVLCRSHDGTTRVTASEIRPYYDLWTEAWKLFLNWAKNNCDEDTVAAQSKDYCTKWAVKGYPRFASLAMAELETAYRGETK